MAYIIYKKAEGVFEIVKDGETYISDSKWAGTQVNGFFDFKSENGARLYSNVYFNEVQYIDETGGTSVMAFASAIALHTKLKEVGFFDTSGGSGSGGSDTFKTLSDTFSSFVGYDGYGIAIDGNFLVPKLYYNKRYFTDLEDVQSDPIDGSMVGQIPMVQMVSDGVDTYPRILLVPFPNQTNTPPDQFTQLGTLTRLGSDITLSVGYTWLLSGNSYGNEDEFEFTVTDAATGDSRVDIIVANPDNTFALIEGVPSAGEGTAVEPLTPIGTLRLTSINVYEDNIVDTGNPSLGVEFVKKTQYHYKDITGSGSEVIETIILNDIPSCLNIISGVSKIQSLTIQTENQFYKGMEIAIKCSQVGNIIIQNNYGSNSSFMFPDGNDFNLKNGYVIKFKENEGNYDYIGVLPNNEVAGVQSVTALDGDAVDNSDPSNPVLNVSTPEASQALADQAELNAKNYTDTRTTTNISEGTRLYFTTARVLATVLAGLNTALTGNITSSDTILQAFGRIQNSITSLTSAVGLRELLSNKINAYAVDGTGTKYYTADYINNSFRPVRVIVADTTPKSAITGLNTLVATYSIPNLPASFQLRAEAVFFKTGTAGISTVFAYFNTGTSMPIIGSCSTAAASTYIPAKRKISFASGVIKYFPSSGYYPNDDVPQNATASYTGFNPALTTNTIRLECSANAGDSIQFVSFTVEILS